MALRIFALTLILTAPLGCGGSSETTGTITGKVSHAGKPLKGGTISFLPAKADAVPLSFLIQDDGSYTATDIPIGDLLISVSPPAGTATATSAATAKARMGELDRAGQPVPHDLMSAAGGGAGNVPKPGDMNSKYSDPFTSGLTFKLTEPNAVHNVDVPHS